MKKRTGKQIALLAFILVVIFILNIFRSPRDTKEHYYNRVSHHFLEVNREIEDFIVSSDIESDNIESKVRDIALELYLLDLILEEGAHNVDDKINYLGRDYDFSFIADTLVWGINSSGHQALWDDGIIDDSEIEFLNTLNIEIVAFYDALNEKNVVLFNKQLNEFFEEWDVNPERNLSGESYYDYLKKDS